MTIPTQMSLHGFISTAPELAYGKSDIGRFRARIGIEQWHKDPDGSFTKLDQKGARNRNYFNPYIWRPALERAGVPDERENGCHALRHFYTSTALHGARPSKPSASTSGTLILGSPSGPTPTSWRSWERTKRAIDTVFGVHDGDDGDRSQAKCQL